MAARSTRGTATGWLVWTLDIGSSSPVGCISIAPRDVTQYISRCNRNIAPGAIMTATEYTALVDDLEAAIAAGRLKPGERLPPQRTFAYDKGIAASTAGRVYAELLRRGLVVGEVGRGTFVAGRPSPAVSIRGEPRDGRIDLEFNFPILPAQSGLIAKSLAGLQRADAMSVAMGPVTQGRLETARAVTAKFMSNATLAAACRWVRVHGLRQAIDCGGHLVARACRRPPRRRGHHLCDNQEHRRQARRRRCSHRHG